MSRSNPTDNTPNPCTRWFEWNGSAGDIRYYDKEKKENVIVGDKFSFMLLDEMNAVSGWHEASESRIYSNEVRDTKQEVFVVKSFKGGELAHGLYATQRDRITAIGGYFQQNCYIAYKDGDTLKLGSLQLNGAALGAWVDFKKNCPSSMVNGKSVKDIYAKAIRITGSTEGKKGSIKFKMPAFAIAPITEQANADAAELDKQLQAYLTSYLSRTKVEQVQVPPADVNAAHSAFAEHDAEAKLAATNRSSQTASEVAAAGDVPDFIDDEELPF